MGESASDSLLLRKALSPQFECPEWPPGYRCLALSDDLMHAAHGLLQLAGPTSGEPVPALHTWARCFAQDPEFDLGLCFIVLDEHGPVALAQGWTSAYLKDLVVHPRARRLGIGRRLLEHMFAHYARRGEACVDLRVLQGNSAARDLYASAGMYEVKRYSWKQPPAHTS